MAGIGEGAKKMNDEKIREAFEEFDIEDDWTADQVIELTDNEQTNNWSYERAVRCLCFSAGYKSRDKELKVAREALEWYRDNTNAKFRARKALKELGEMG
jgi:hypothetical protein